MFSCNVLVILETHSVEFVQLAGFHLTPDEMQQTLGAEVTLAALANRSATLVPILVRAYTNSLKQTLSSVQSEVRSAQQVVVSSVSALSQQLTTFNDSTVIGNSFVRYEEPASEDAGGILDILRILKIL